VRSASPSRPSADGSSSSATLSIPSNAPGVRRRRACPAPASRPNHPRDAGLRIKRSARQCRPELPSTNSGTVKINSRSRRSPEPKPELRRYWQHMYEYVAPGRTVRSDAISTPSARRRSAALSIPSKCAWQPGQRRPVWHWGHGNGSFKRETRLLHGEQRRRKHSRGALPRQQRGNSACYKGEDAQKNLALRWRS